MQSNIVKFPKIMIHIIHILISLYMIYIGYHLLKYNNINNYHYNILILIGISMILIHLKVLITFYLILYSSAPY